jgi:hypothetical protein
MEKEFEFTEQLLGGEPPVVKIVKESELTDAQKQLLLGDIIQQYGELPTEVQTMFRGIMSALNKF